MHEFSMASEILEVVLRAARDADADTVTAVHITLGRRSHLDRGVLADAFEMAAAGTAADAARLQVSQGSAESDDVAVTAVDVGSESTSDGHVRAS